MIVRICLELQYQYTLDKSMKLCKLQLQMFSPKFSTTFAKFMLISHFKVSITDGRADLIALIIDKIMRNNENMCQLVFRMSA